MARVENFGVFGLRSAGTVAHDDFLRIATFLPERRVKF